MSDKLQDAVKELRERYGDIPLSNAIIKTIDHDIYLEETNKYLRERLYEARETAIDLDKNYSNCLIRIRELNEEIDRLKTEVELYKSSMNHYKGITLKNKSKFEIERDYIKMKYDVFKNVIQAMLPEETVKAIYSEFTKRMNEWEREEVYKQIEPLFNKED